MIPPIEHPLPRRVVVRPGPLEGTVSVPGDKSIGHRALIIGALADGPCDLVGVPSGEDVLATADAVRAMGGLVHLEPGDHGLDGHVSGPLQPPSEPIDCGNSGTGLRLLAGVAAGMAGATTLTGDESLRARPMGRISRPLRELGARVDGPDDGTRAPLTVHGVIRDGGVLHSEVASAQVKSALLLAAVRAGVGITVTAPLPSRDHTERMLRDMGLPVTHGEPGDDAPASSTTPGSGDPSVGERVVMEPGATPRATTLIVPGDPSSATFWWAAAAVGSRSITTPGVCMNPGRTGALQVLEELGASIVVSEHTPAGSEEVADVTVEAGTGLPGGATMRGRAVVDAIDEIPVLAIVAALSDGGLEVADAAELRAKESDRIASLARLFAALGMQFDARPDGFRVPGGQQPRGGTFDAGLDHRLAMTAAIAATVASEPVTIAGFASTASSYPGFRDDFVQLGGRLEPEQ
ncbi:MAG: 3-phosphoshikimate 1-carboxyvinyltransferase [Nitriliruptorales bacterium]|nr:3-phosphoshikimate 1-carboxyvinyltransferase [Nitriliruptorales bacterium]